MQLAGHRPGAEGHVACLQCPLPSESSPRGPTACIAGTSAAVPSSIVPTNVEVTAFASALLSSCTLGPAGA